MEVIDRRVWQGQVSSNWRHREAAANSVLKYVESGAQEMCKKEGTSKTMYLAMCEFARNCCDDKILSIYFTGLKILQQALAPPICGPDVTPHMVNQTLKEFAPVLIGKTQELNSKASEVSLATLLSIYKHPAAEPKGLTSEIMKKCTQGRGIAKEPPRVPLSLMQIAVRAYHSLPAVHKEYKSLTQNLFAPCLTHASEQVRLKAIDCLIFLGEENPKFVDQAIAEQEGIRPIMYDIIKERRAVFNKD
jgi:centrosomal protein CEP104